MGIQIKEGLVMRIGRGAVAGVFLLAAVAAGLIGCADKPAEETRAQSPSSQLETLQLAIHGMHCEGCAVGIQAALAELPGVVTDTVSYADSLATLTIDPKKVDTPALIQVVAGLGYGASPLP